AVATVTGNGKAVVGRPITVRLFQREVYTHRKKLVGGTFAYENTVNESDRGLVCTGVTNKDGILGCKADLQLSGEFVLEASSVDLQGRESKSASVVFVGNDDYWFAQENTDRMDLLPERKRYEPGEVARFQVRVPFKQSTALVSVEREGIVDAFVMPLSRSNPIIELPVKEHYGPNVFVSVMAVRGRIDEAKPTAVFDPGKPAYRLGMNQIQVGWRGYELKVGVSTERSVFKVREKVPVKIQVRTPEGHLPPNGSEVTVAAVDEGLLELKPNISWNLLESVMNERWLGVETFTAQMFVIGKRHFGLKALPFGGGGGKATSRELFDTLLYWNPSVPLDSNGEASVEVPLNDSITSFKIVAVANGGISRFGTGSTSIRSSKDFILFAGMPPEARTGDHFAFEITARNATADSATVDVTLQSSVDAGAGRVQQVELASGESKVLSWPVQVPQNAEQIKYSAVIARAGVVEDSLAVTQRITPAVPVRMQQATLLQLTKPQSIPVQVPAQALPGRGGLQVGLLASLGDAGSGLREYMRQYPFGCLEQRISKAVALEDGAFWGKIQTDLRGYLDRDGFAKYFPTMDRGDEVLTSYLLSIANAAGWTLPEAVKQRMIE
ncbi:MAG: alpha-2-macroglobulin, partial [Proteobacteria bacterium]|nr:alpha-2-macroglobulin [Pseudomonadota bacterium]